MDIKEWENSFHGPSGVTRIHQIWSQIQSRSYLDNPLFYEYLCVCIFLAISEHVKISYNLKLNDDFEPKSVAPSGKPDIVVEFDNFFLVIEATLRPIDGKVDHFSHLKLIDSINNVMGLLVVPDIQKVDDQVWNTYKAYFNHDKKSFFICDVRFLLSILESDSVGGLENFLKYSEQIWKSRNSWKEVKTLITKFTTKN